MNNYIFNLTLIYHNQQLYHLEDTGNDLNMVCLNEKSKAFIYDGDEDKDEIKVFVKKFISGKYLIKF